MSTSMLERDAKEPFPSALFLDHEQEAIHRAELSMRSLSYAIRSKPNWWEKMTDEKIRAKWTDEALDIPAGSIGLVKKHVDYVLDELEWFNRARDAETGCQPSLQGGFWEADNLIPDDLHAKLDKEIAKLRDVPDNEKDWHPGSDQQVLDLIHPSMYCLRYGKTFSTEGPVLPPPTREYPGYTTLTARSSEWNPSEGRRADGVSDSTSWLPTDFAVASDGKSVVARSYINNVHPETQGALHNALSSLLGKFIPLFSRAAADLVKFDRTGTVLGASQSELDEGSRPENPNTGQPVMSWDYDDAGDNPLWEDWIKTEPYIEPTPNDYVPIKRTLGTGYTLNGKTIQVIVKIAEIHLTPEKPRYEGGTWHIEGMLNESIVATGLYYMTCENITKTTLGFRVALDSEGPQEYEQNDPDGIIEHSYGLVAQGPLNQSLGRFVAQERRCLVFPNLYQHKVDPFQLADPTKPGRRTIVAFFLCDPSLKIPSTTVVPPQQVDWLKFLLLRNKRADSSIPTLPIEVRERILDMLVQNETYLDRAGAEKVRAELMKERSNFVKIQDENNFEAEYK